MAAAVMAAPSAAWAGPNHHHAARSTSRTSGSHAVNIYGSTGNPNYGWVIPLTFVYAPGYGPG